MKEPTADDIGVLMLHADAVLKNDKIQFCSSGALYATESKALGYNCKTSQFTSQCDETCKRFVQFYSYKMFTAAEAHNQAVHYEE